MAYNSKFKGAEIDELLDKVNDGAVLETYSEDGTTSASITATEGVTVEGGTAINLYGAQVLVNDEKVVTESDLDAKQDKLTAGDGISIKENVIAIDPTSDFFQNLAKTQVENFILAGGGNATNMVALMQSVGLGNLYVKLVGSSAGDSVVTIGGSSVTIGAGETYEGFVDSFTAVGTNNLKEVVVVGDTSVILGSNSVENDTLESVAMYKTGAWSGTMLYFVRACTALRSVSVAGGKPTSLSDAFRDCSALTSLDLSGLDLSACTTLQQLCYGCTSLTSLDLQGLDLSACTTLQQLCYGCTSLTSLDLQGLDLSACTTLANLCYGCTSLTSLNLQGLDLSACTTLQSLCNGCTSLTSLNLQGLDLNTCTTLQQLCYGCTSLTSLNLQGLDLGACTNLSYLCYGCTSLTSLDLTGINTPELTATNRMLQGCSALTAVDLSDIDFSKVTTIAQMFNGCSSLTSLTLGDCDWGSVETATNSFDGDRALTDVLGTLANLRVSLSVNYAPLTRESALVFINGLSDEPSEENPTLTLSSTTKALLTDEDIAIATDKGWTIA